MARNFGVVAFATAICISSLIGVAYCHDQFVVHGKIFCDTCRVAFETPISYAIPGSHIGLSCRNRTTNAVTFTSNVTTDMFGEYDITVEGDREGELCEISLVKSGDSQCDQFLPDHIINNARVSLTSNNGLALGIRYANSLFFATKDALPNCADVLRQMGILPPEIIL